MKHFLRNDLQKQIIGSVKEDSPKALQQVDKGEGQGAAMY